MSQPSGSDSNSSNNDNELNGCETPVVRDHTLLRRIGRGSYGDVWLARNSTGAFRAVKIVYRRGFKETRPFEREFSGIQKFEPVSRSHEGFIDVLQVGINEDEEYFYYVMELGDDAQTGQQIDPASYSAKTLSKVMRKHDRLPVAECLPVALGLSRALMELHKNKLVHRDIKPSNIIFVNGSPKLADIGLVAGVDEARSYVGTEGFIPPEGPGTPQADIYSLGKVLYEIATGRDRHDFPDLPDLNALPDRDAFLEFNEVIIKACNGNPTQRYESAAEMHADLLVLENGQSVRRLHTLERRWIAFKRLATVAGIVLVVASAIGFGIYSKWRSSEATRQQQVGAEIAYGNAAMESGDYLAALPHFTSAYLLDKPDAAHKRAHELRIGSLLESSPKLTHLLSRKRQVSDAVFSPDGKWLAIAENGGNAYLYNLQTRELSEPFASATFALTLCFSPDGSRIATASEDGPCTIWTVPGLAKVRRLDHPTSIANAKFSPDGRSILTACRDGVARLWNVESGALMQKWVHGKTMRSATLSHNGKLVVTCGEDNMARVWSLTQTKKPLNELRHAGWVNCAAFSPDDTKLVTATSHDHKARVWDVSTGAQLFPELVHLDSVGSAEFSPDGKLILTASLEGMARLWDADTRTPVAANAMLKHTDRVIVAKFDPTGRKIVITGNDGTVRVWDFSDSTTITEATRTVYSADGSAMAVIDDDRVQLSRGDVQFDIATANIENVFFSQHGHAFVLRERGSEHVEAWSMAERKKVMRISTSFTNCIPNENGTRMLGYGANILRLWTSSAGATNPLMVAHVAAVQSAAFNPAGDTVITCSRNYIHVWDAATGQKRYAAIAFRQPVSHGEFSPDGRMIVGCCSNPFLDRCYAQVFDASTGKPITSPLNHGDGVLWATFSPDSKRLATTSEDFSAAIWDIRTSAQTCKTMLHRDQVSTAAFSADGGMLATAAADNSVHIWSTETGDPLTPPMRCETRDKRTIFTHDGVAIVAVGATSLLWHFPQNIPGAEDLNDLAMLLSGSALKSAAAGAMASNTEKSSVRWEKLHKRYPGLFAVAAGNNPVGKKNPSGAAPAGH